MRWCFWARKSIPTVAEVSGEFEIPRYPPFERGLPAVSLDKVVGTQTDMLQRLFLTAAMPERQFDELIVPAVRKLAEYVHLLPASRATHHTGGGGLLRHGIESGYLALQACSAHVFKGAGVTTDQRRNLEPRWRHAVFLAALYLPTGIAVSKMRVLDAKGEHWLPFTESLVDWCRRGRVDQYYVEWRDATHDERNALGGLLGTRLISKESLAYICECNGHERILQDLNKALSGEVNQNSKVQTIARTAIKASAEQDSLSAIPAAYVDTASRPLQRYIYDAIRRLLRSKWTTNRNGARVWVTQEGVHIVWQPASQDIIELLEEDGIEGIPKDPDSLAEILVDHGLAEMCEDSDGEKSLYMEMQVSIPRIGNVTLPVLRIVDGERLFDKEPQVPIVAAFGGRSEVNVARPTDAHEIVVDLGTKVPEVEKGRDESKNEGASTDLSPQSTDVSQLELVAPVAKAADKVAPTQGRRTERPKKANKQRQEAGGVSGDASGHLGGDPVSGNPLAGTRSETLLALITKDLRAGQITAIPHPDDKSRLCLRYPDDLGRFGYPPERVMDMLKESKAIESVVGKPFLFIHDLGSDGEKGSVIMFSADVSDYIRKASGTETA